MSKSKEHRFRIDVFTPETLPMERLAEYMMHFAQLLGEREHVHFVTVEAGSAVLKARVEEPAIPIVGRRIADAAQGLGDPVALKAVQYLDDMLANDNAIGQLLDEAGAELIAFKGRTRPKPLEYGPFREDGVLEGVVIKVGGKGPRVPVWLQDGEVIHKNCSAERTLARKLARHYDAGVIRVSGSGNWMRLATGAWIMRGFEIKHFDLLDDAPLAEVIKRLHGVEGAAWGEDPLGDLARIRAGEDVT